ncbi:EpsG family protein [Vibrio harveyi]|uniref:EpsG family protein n=1 Tax=Vibrio harveyi TaxID=669 RepID=UPI004067922D
MLSFYTFSACIFVLYTLSFFEGYSRNGEYVKLLAAYFTLSFILIFSFYKPIGLGYDDLNYLNGLINPNYGILYQWEPGYRFLNNILYQMNLVDFSFLSVSVVGLSMAINIYSIKKFSPLLCLSLIYYLSHLFLFKEMTQFRSAISYSICLLSFYQLFQGKKFQFLALVGVACLFHKSAIISLLAILANRLTLRSLFTLLIASILLSITGAVKSLIMLSASFVLSDDAYGTYINASSVFATSVGLTNPVTLKYIFILLIGYLVYKYNGGDNKFLFTLKIYSLSSIWITFFSDFGTIAGRPASIFSSMECIVLAYICYRGNIFSRYVYQIILFIFSILILLTNLLIKESVNFSQIYQML